MKEFEDILVSGREKLLKPDKRFFHLLLERHQLAAEKSLFIDDVLKNIEAAKSLGFQTIQFKSPEQLQEELIKLRFWE